MEGWIKLHRQLLNSDIWLIDKPYDERSAWIYLLLMANHEDKNVILGNDVVEVKRGSFITSEIKLMKKWGWSKTKVRSFLKLLENDGMIIKKSDHKKTTITIINYSSFQNSQTTKEPEKNHEETTEEPIQIHKQERKNEKKEKKIHSNCECDQQTEELFERLWELYPSKRGKSSVTAESKVKLFEIGFNEMSRAIERYKHELKINSWQHIQYGSTFFNHGYVDYLDENYSSSERNKPTKTNQFNNFSQREYDETELNKMVEDEMIRLGGDYG